MQNKSLSKTILVGLFTAISLILFLLEFPIIPGNSALKLDFSDIPPLVGAVLFGPFFGVAVEALKNILELIFKGLGTQMGFGNLMNFIVGVAYIVPFALFYKALNKNERIRGLAASYIAGAVATACIVLAGLGANYVIAPLFFKYFLNQEIPKSVLWTFIGSASILNAVKGLLLTVCAYPLSSVLKKQVKISAMYALK
ncbi:MAG TPA: ECF transporter S component [Clostridiales bacterium]|nr:ECF transporter S component [Clostridiales bacterium]